MSEINPLQTELPVINLMPGELFVAREPTLITTVLGSCVAVSLYSPRLKIGAMCHSLLPFNRKETKKEDFRFVDNSINFMVDALVSQGAMTSEIECKLFGGADVIQINMESRKGPTVGSRNISAARLILRRHRLTVAMESVGGVNGYKLFYYSHKGEILLESIPRRDQAR